MKIAIPNDSTKSLVQAWINKTARLPERHDIDAWMWSVGQSVRDCLSGESIIIEMSRIFTDSGNPETLIIPASNFDWVEIKE